MEKQSMILSTRITEYEQEIASLQERLTTLTDAKQHALHDEKKLGALEKEESELPGTIARLEQRRVLLGREREQALKAEALTRMPEIEQELATLGGRIGSRRATFLKGIDALLQLIKDDYPDRQRAGELQAEAEYFHVAYDAPGPQAPPAVALNRTDTLTLDAEFAKHYQLLFAGGRWKELTDAIRQQKNAVAQQDADSRRRASSSSLGGWYTPPFTAGGKA